MPCEYSENICEKMATGKELDELYNKENRDLKWKSKIIQVEREHQ